LKYASGVEVSPAIDQKGQAGDSSMLSVIRNNFDINSDKASNSADLAYMSIRGLKCEFAYSTIDTRTKCHVKIIKGKHNIMKFPVFLNFDGEGESEKNAKFNAFDNFIVLVRGFCD
jgi:hypothetical protein